MLTLSSSNDYQSRPVWQWPKWRGDWRLAVTVHTCECLLYLLFAGGPFQQPSNEHNDVLKAGPLAWILIPALLQVEEEEETYKLSQPTA